MGKPIYIRKSVFVSHHAQRMYELVNAVENYPNFLPWCSKVQVHSRTPHHLDATVHIQFLGVRSFFRTYNYNETNCIRMVLLEGPFRVFRGQWRFIALSKTTSRVEFDLDYQLSNKVLEMLLGAVIDKIIQTLVECFVQEADRRTK